jgi:hypothetical protein
MKHSLTVTDTRYANIDDDIIITENTRTCYYDIVVLPIYYDSKSILNNYADACDVLPNAKLGMRVPRYYLHPEYTATAPGDVATCQSEVNYKLTCSSRRSRRRSPDLKRLYKGA